MTKTALYGTILAVAFVISMVVTMPLADAGGHIFIKKTEVKVKDLTKLNVKIKVTGAIPLTGGPFPFGYGTITDPVGFNNVLALTSHPGVLDHPAQTSAADPVFHAHVLDLVPVAGVGSIPNPCLTDPSLSDVVVDFASSIASGNNIGAPYKVKVKDKTIEVKKVPTTDLDDAGVEAIVAFKIVPVGIDMSAPLPGIPWLCLDIVGFGVGL